MSYRADTTVRPAQRRYVSSETGRKTARYAASLSVTAALIHLWAAPEHLRDWWGYGAFFLATALGQGLYGAALLHGLCRHRSLMLLGCIGNLGIVVLYVLTRTIGIPFLGPHAGETEGVGPLDLTATASELALVLALGALARDWDLPIGGRGAISFGLALLLVLSAYGVPHHLHRSSPPDDHEGHHAMLDPGSPDRSKPSGGQRGFDLGSLPVVTLDGPFERDRPEKTVSGLGANAGANGQEKNERRNA